MNRLTRLGAGWVFGACGLLLAAEAAAVPECASWKVSSRQAAPSKSVTQIIDDARRDMGALAFGQAEQKLRLALDEQSARSHSRVWLYDALGSVYVLQKRDADAEQAYRSALALELSVGMRHEMQIKLAGALFALQKDDELIGLLEAIEKNECAPVSDAARYWLATAYAAKGRLADAERVVPKGEKNYAPEYSVLHWRLKCALNRVGECAQMLATRVPLMKPSPEKAQWCAKLVASLARAPEAAAGLQEARAKGAIDSENRCVFGQAAPSTPYDELIPVARTPPRYPRAALRDYVSGTVEFELTVAPDGSVSNMKIIESSPPGVFDEAATTAMKEWRFKPKVVDGVAVESTGTQRLDFKIGRP